MLRKFVASLLILFLIVFFGPRPEADFSPKFEPSLIGEDVENYLSTSEARLNDIRAEHEKQIIWADPNTKQKTEFSVVYIHGFSASKFELTPIAENFSAALKANLYFTRLRGHGRSPQAMEEASVEDWMKDVAEAKAIGERLGEQVIIIGTSHGGALLDIALDYPDFQSNVAGVVFVAPNFKINSSFAFLLTQGWAEYYTPWILGDTLKTEPLNEQHAKYWTHNYPISALHDVQLVAQRSQKSDKSRIKTPALFIYSPRDQVADPKITERRFENWGGPKKILRFEETGDRYNHLVAGDARSPVNNEVVLETLIKWHATLK